jgi:molybdopterin molybdotransferase
MVEAEGGQARMLPIAPDDEAALAHVLRLAATADLIVTIGGASVGDHDLVGRVAGLEHSFWKLALRPGKPLMAGRLNGVPMLGLPGNPVSAIVCGHLFLLPMVRAMLGDPSPAPRPRQARLAVDLPANGPRAHYMRARLSAGDGMPAITPFDRQDSALLSILGEADALLIRPIGDGPRGAGSTVDYLPL